MSPRRGAARRSRHRPQCAHCTRFAARISARPDCRSCGARSTVVTFQKLARLVIERSRRLLRISTLHCPEDSCLLFLVVAQEADDRVYREGSSAELACAATLSFLS